jgi:7-cyano-7-deazaguanine tRNA-ribosyltransferase
MSNNNNLKNIENNNLDRSGDLDKFEQNLNFEILNRDGLGRIGLITTKHGKFKSPTLFPVINPNDKVITATEMQKLFGAKAVITNSYIIHKSKSLHETALKKGVHGLLAFDGPIMTDSGSFQLYTYGKVKVQPNDIIEFQNQIKPDIGTILDVFGTADLTYDEAASDVNETLLRAQEAIRVRDGIGLAGTVQGGQYPELRQHCAIEMSKLPFEIHPIGGVVPFMEEYRFKELVRIILASKKGLTPARPVHLFGAGHPMLFPLAVALGCDTFDSASYIKYADDDRFLFSYGTKKLEHLETLPCICPICSDTSVSELKGLAKDERRKLIAKHNLYICFNEIELIRQAIIDGTLWELVEQRARSHPHLLQSLVDLYHDWKYLEQFEPISRRRFLYVGSESMERPDIKRFQDRIKNRYKMVKTKTVVCIPEPGNRTDSFEDHYENELKEIWKITDAHVVFQTIFGPVPIELAGTYPMGQAVVEPGLANELANTKRVYKQMEQYSHGLISEFPIVWTGEETLDDLRYLAKDKNKFNLDFARIRAIADYQFGPGAADVLLKGDLEFIKSKNTGKIRNIKSHGEHILSLRASDGLFTLKKSGAERLHKGLKPPNLRVVVNSDSAQFNLTGKNVFAKFVISCDQNLRPGDEVLVTDEADELVAIGRLVLNWYEMEAFNSGIAVRVREGFE